MNQEFIVPELEEWDVNAIAWDGAGSHRGQQVQALNLTTIVLPPYCLDLPTRTQKVA